MSLLHLDKVTSNRAEFEAKVISGSKSLAFDPNWLMQVMYNESGLNHQAVNKQEGDSDNPFERTYKRGTGLIQFMPSTAISLGTTNQALYNMSNVAQLEYVFKYLRAYRYKIWSYIDLYFSVFFPLAIGKPGDWVFKASKLSAALVASQNKGFDLNKDGILTVSEVEQAMLAKVPEPWKSLFKKKT